MLDNFGSSIGSDAILILPSKNSYASNRRTILSLKWDKQTRSILAQEKNPYLLVLSSDISDFKPKLDDHVIIEFPNPTADLNKCFDILFDLNCGCFENSSFAGAETAVFKQSKV
jgi:hypothetical protein